MKLERRTTLPMLPIACTLTASQGRDQLLRWKAFDDDYLLGIEETATRYVVRYSRTTDSQARLAELIAQEASCCSFASWSMDTTHEDLRLIVTGSPDAIAALSIR